MRLAHAVRVGAWLLVGLNLLMAFGTIGIFSRMTPAIALIIERNGYSIKACADMLSLVALAGGDSLSAEGKKLFMAAFERTRSNVTEPEEPAVLKEIEDNFPAVFQGAAAAREATVNSIVHLSKINQTAMVKADRKAQQLGQAGAWGVVFMAISAFLAGMLFIKNLARRVITPLEEIHAVLIAHRNGETMRRCTGTNLAQDMRAVFTGINDILDQFQSRDGHWDGEKEEHLAKEKLDESAPAG